MNVVNSTAATELRDSSSGRIGSPRMWDRPADSDLPEQWKGLPHLACTSEESLPVILGLREFSATEMFIVGTEAHPAESWVRLMRASGIKPIAVPLDQVGVLAPHNLLHNRQVGQKLRTWLAKRVPSSVLWNYTPGTKQMFLGMYQGLTDKGENKQLQG